jgi:antitoxin component of MazEF toxin-antitoxin module
MTKSAAKKVGILACRKQKYTLAQLLKGVRPDNIHPAVDWGPPVGKELL